MEPLSTFVKRMSIVFSAPRKLYPASTLVMAVPWLWLVKDFAQHLEVCPASVVTCTTGMEPMACERDWYHLLQECPSRIRTGWSQLDLAMALRDQKLLFSSIQMKKLFPELIENIEEPEVPLDGAVGGVDPECLESLNLTQKRCWRIVLMVKRYKN